MSGNSTVTLNPGVSGSVVYTEDIGSSTQMPVSKIHTGALGVDGGPVTTSNPFPVQIAGGVDRTSTGTITSTQSVAVNTQACGTATILITGTWTGTIAFEASVDGTTWNAVNGIVPTTGIGVTTTAANGTWIVDCAGFQQVRARGNTVLTGTATVTLNASTVSDVVVLGDALPTGANTIGAVTAPGAAALALDATLTGGTLVSQNKSGTKGGSTGALLTSTPNGANHEALDVSIYDGSGNLLGTLSNRLAVVLPTVASSASAARLTPDGTNLTSATAGIPAILTDNAAAYTAAKTGQLPTSLGAQAIGSSLSITPATSSVYDVSDRAARLAGALTGINGSGVATGANPVPVELSDGTAVLLATSSHVLRTQLDFGYPAAPWSTAAFSSFATAGVALKSSAGIFRFIQFINNTGGAVFLMLFDRTTSPSNGAVPVAVSSSTASGTLGNLNTFEGGLPCATGVDLIFSSTFTTLTTIASTAATGVYVYA